MENFRTVVIMVGAAGSGKTSHAGRLMAAAEVAGVTVAIHSTDSFFVEDGGYRFDPNRLMEYHDANREAFIQSLEQGIDLVIVDNTNLLRAHREGYTVAARRMGYRVEYVVVGSFDTQVSDAYAARNAHGCPRDAIARMMTRYQPVSADEAGVDSIITYVP